jgi:hypothetical protein
MRRVNGTLLAVLLIGCSDDTTPQRDLAAPDKPAGGEQIIAADKSGAGEQPAPTPDRPATSFDKAVPAPDKPVVKVEKGPATDNGGGNMILTAGHSGWGKTACDTCHKPLPLPKHTATTPPQCAQCHGGNGACNPNGPNSVKQNHTAAMSCTSLCHYGSKHGFSANADCVACHFAIAGTSNCPP